MESDTLEVVGRDGTRHVVMERLPGVWVPDGTPIKEAFDALCDALLAARRETDALRTKLERTPPPRTVGGMTTHTLPKETT